MADKEIKMAKDDEFNLTYHQMQEDLADVVLGEVVNRAVDGFFRPVVSMGKIVYQANGEPLMERVVSDKLLTILLKRHYPEYRENSQVAINQAHNQQEIVIDTRNLSAKQLEQLTQIAMAMKRQEGSSS